MPPSDGSAAPGATRCARWLAGWALALASAALGAERPPIEDWRLEPFEWRGRLASGSEVVVGNPFGDVRARRADGDSIAVYAMRQRHREDPREWRIEIERVAAGERRALRVEVLPPGDEAPDATPAWAPRRVDLTVYVPAGARLSVETDGGLIEAKRLASDVAARSAGGEIVITTAGSVDARSRTGRIRYSFLEPGWAGSARLVTEAGDVRVTLPEGSSVELAIRTRGEIRTWRAGEAAPPEAGAVLRAVMGAGGSPVSIESETGNVEVWQLPS